MITAPQLGAAGVGPTQAAVIITALNAACARFEISTPSRIAAFVGQCMVESACFVHLEEDLYYRHADSLARAWPSRFPTAAAAAPYLCGPEKLANHVYAGRNGNGDEASGDGYLFRGRGVLQITGREKYADASEALGRDYLASPAVVALPDDACLTAAWFWHVNKLNALADAGAIDAITRAINGPGMLEVPLRRQYTQQALAAMAA